MMDNNPKFNSIFNETDPNIIVNIFITEMNTIINTLAPTHRVQINKYNKYKLSNEVNDAIASADQQRTKAINALNREEF